MRMIGIVSVFILLAAAGCSDSPEHKLEQARVALNSGRPDTALALVQQVLEARPGDPAATLILARAHLRLRHYADSEKVLKALAAHDPAAVDPQRELLNLALSRMADLLASSEFNTNPQVQESFTSAKELGYLQADWLSTTGKLLAEAEFARARLLMLDAQRIEKLIQLEEARLRNEMAVSNPDDPVTSPGLEEQKQQVAKMLLTAEQHLGNVYEAEPTTTTAMLKLNQLMNRRKAWDDSWELTRKAAKNPNLPAAAAIELARGVLAMPDDFRPLELRIQLARMVMDVVSKEGKESPNWKTMASRLHLLDGEFKVAHQFAEEAVRVQPEDRDSRFMLGWSLFKLGKFAPSKIVLERLVSDHKDFSDAWTLLGLAQIQLGNKALADDALRTAISLNKNDRVARAAQINLWKSDQDSLSRSRENINRFYEENPKDPEAIRYKLDLEVASGGLTEVRNILGAVEKMSLPTPELRESLVGAYLFVSNLPKAEEHALALAQLRPESPDDQLRLALVRQKREPAREFILHLRELQQKFKNHLPTALLVSKELIRLGQFDSAVEILDKLRPAYPDNTQVRLLLAKCYGGLSMTEEALDQIDFVLKVSPTDMQAHELAARLHRMMGQPEIARQHLERIEESQFSEEENPGALAHLKFAKEDYEGALRVCNAAVAAGRTDAFVRLILAELQNRANNPVEAEAQLLANVRATPQDFNAYLALISYFSARNVDQGLTELENLRAVNDELGGLAKAMLLLRASRHSDALATATPLYAKLVRNRSPLALSCARLMAGIILAKGPDRYVDAAAVYQVMVDAKLSEAEARIAQIDVTWRKPDEGSTLARLDGLAVTLLPEQTAQRYDVYLRYSKLNKPEAALPHLDRWLRVEPSNADLLLWKGEALLQSGNLKDSVDFLQQAVKARPDSLVAYQRIAQAALVSRDFAGAEAVYDRMGAINPNARLYALWSKGLMFRDAGLEKPALEAFELLGKAGRGSDPRVNYAIGQGLAALGRNEDAIKRLIFVPAHAKEFYLPAQVALARIEYRLGRLDQAKNRLTRLVGEEETRVAAVQELAKLSANNPEDDSILAWSDTAIKIADLPPQLRVLWTTLRLMKHAQNGRWDELGKALDQAIALSPGATQWRAARILLRAQQGETEEARNALLAADGLKASRFGAFLAAGLGTEPLKAADSDASLEFFQALVSGDIAHARLLAARMNATDGFLFGSDLRAFLDSPDLTDAQSVAVWRRLALANLAFELQLFTLCDALCADVLKARPDCVLAHGLRLSSITNQGKPATEAMRLIAAAVPDSTLRHWVRISESQSAGQLENAIAAAKLVISRDPTHVRTLLHLVQLYQQAKLNDQALALLGELHQSQQGWTKAVVANDLAYLLSQQAKPDLDRAQSLAASAVESFGQVAAFRDTLGWIEHLRGRQLHALVHLNSAIVFSRTSASMHLHLGEVYRTSGNIRWARFHLEAAAALPGEESQRAKDLLQSLAAEK